MNRSANNTNKTNAPNAKPAKKKDEKFWLRLGCLVFAGVMILSVFMTLILQIAYAV